MNVKYNHYAYLFVKEELERINKSIESETNEQIKVQLNNRRIELQNGFKDLENLIQ